MKRQFIDFVKQLGLTCLSLLAIALSLIIVLLIFCDGCIFLFEQPDYCVCSVEQAKEYFPKYISGVDEIIEKYTSDYTFEQSDNPEEIPVRHASSYSLYTCYTFSEKLYLRLTYNYWEWKFGDDETSNYSYFVLTMHNKAESTDELQLTAEEYGAMMYEISNYCGHKVHGSQKTLASMYKSALKKFNKKDTEINTENFCFVRKYQPLNTDEWEGTIVEVGYKEEEQRYYLVMYTAFYLSDRNIIDKG